MLGDPAALGAETLWKIIARWPVSTNSSSVTYQPVYRNERVEHALHAVGRFVVEREQVARPLTAILVANLLGDYMRNWSSSTIGLIRIERAPILGTVAQICGRFLTALRLAAS